MDIFYSTTQWQHGKEKSIATRFTIKKMKYKFAIRKMCSSIRYIYIQNLSQFRINFEMCFFFIVPNYLCYVGIHVCGFFCSQVCEAVSCVKFCARFCARARLLCLVDRSSLTVNCFRNHKNKIKICSIRSFICNICQYNVNTKWRCYLSFLMSVSMPVM